MDEITIDDIPALTLGAGVLATGGGGEPFVPRLMVEEALRRHGPVPLVQPGDLDPDGLLLPLAVVGAPTAFAERFFNGSEPRAALTALERHLGRKGVGVLPIEVGGGSTLLPIAAAAELGLPVVDADTMRRAFPRGELTHFHLAGISASPIVLVDTADNLVIVEATDNPTAERLARSATTAMGMIAVGALYPVTAAQAAAHAIHGSLSYCAEIGRHVRAIQEGAADGYTALLAATGGRIVFTGKIVDLNRRTEGGWARGTVTLDDLDGANRTLRVDFQNENLVAGEDGLPLVTTPDLISLLDVETGTPMTTETLGYGQRLTVLALPAHPRWHEPDGIELAGPRAFGYDLDYVPFGGHGE
ncbi:DUF917 domain-containing protein [Pseudonocardia benzenivorans]|uniref:DUF917 domain-containing protein n=1 Tax=Pseudonocardia benzenivorans TaxID=228005 RepID=A0ABW3VB53_9PSEU